MALFELPKYQDHVFTITPELQVVIDSGKLDASQVKKFAHFPELLEEELDNESRNPDAANLEEDIFVAIYENDPSKFVRCASRVLVDNNILNRVFSWIMSKKSIPTQEEVALAALEKEFLELSERQDLLMRKYNRGKATVDEVKELAGLSLLVDAARLPAEDLKRLQFLRKRREITKRDVALISRIERSHSVYNIFDY